MESTGATVVLSRTVDEVLLRANLPYKMDGFQKQTLHALASKRSVILSASCGSGKFVIAYTAVEVLRIEARKPSGVGIILVPLNAMMEEFSKTYPDVATLSMAGDLSVHESELTTGRVRLLIAHAESFLTPMGKCILEMLEEAELLIFVCLDECDKFTSGQWGGEHFRDEMRSIPASIRAKCADSSFPCLAMTATLTLMEGKEVQEILCIDEPDLVRIKVSPIQNHVRLVKVKRPSSLKGNLSSDGQLLAPGDIHLVDRLALREFSKCVDSGDFNGFKKTLIFTFSKEGCALNDLLCERHPNIPSHKKPWIFSHSKIDDVTIHSFNKRIMEGTAKVIICTSTLLMGVNLPLYDVMIMLGPYSHLNDLQQAWGRVGRRFEGKKRRQSLAYICYNKTTLSNIATQDVKDFCDTNMCLKKFVNELFGNTSTQSSKDRCCSNCN
jgi:superfamily II DNA helicase RecQ